MKESIFNVLSSRIKAARVLDLFSGTGSLGLESLSRGCRLVYFIDKDTQSMDLIRYNTENLASNQTDIGSFEIIQKDVLEYLRFCNIKKWDIIFLDPPYKIGADMMKSIFDIIAGRGIAAEKTLLVYEFFFKRDIEEEIEKLEIVKQSFFGDKKVLYLKIKESSGK